MIAFGRTPSAMAMRSCKTTWCGPRLAVDHHRLATDRIHMNRLSVLVTALLILSSAAFSGVPESTIANSLAPAPSPSPQFPTEDKMVVYSGAAIIDGTGRGLQPDMAIVVDGERIEAVAPAAQLKVPPGAEVVDVKNQYGLPGFINSHEHLATPPNRKFAEAMMRRDLFSGVTAAR